MTKHEMSKDEAGTGGRRSSVFRHFPVVTCGYRIVDGIERDRRPGFRSRDDPRLRPGLSLGKGRWWIYRHNWPARYLCRTSRRNLAWQSRPRGIGPNYFALDHPLAEIYDSFSDDPVIKAALASCRVV